jgi:hypothetical protein
MKTKGQAQTTTCPLMLKKKGKRLVRGLRTFRDPRSALGPRKVCCNIR